jgi:hypothetical protein
MSPLQFSNKHLPWKINGYPFLYSNPCENQSRLKTRKLIPTSKDKKNYVVHYRNLQLYIELGMKITKIPRIYIDFNSNMRKHAKNDFEKDLFKLMCNRHDIS